MSNLLSLGTVATALGLVLTVAAYKMNARSANVMLVIAWVLFGTTVFSSIPWIQKQAMIPRLLWTACISGAIGLLLYQLWTHSDAPQVAENDSVLSDEISVLVDCQMVTLPTRLSAGIDWWMAWATKSDSVIGLNLIPVPNLDPSKDMVLTWNDRGTDSQSMGGVLCKLTNNYGKPLVELDLLVNTKFQEVFAEPNGAFVAGKLLEHDFTIRVPRLEVSDPFRFYVVNETQTVFSFSFLRDESTNVAGIPGRKPVRLIFATAQSPEIRLSPKNAKLIEPPQRRD